VNVTEIFQQIFENRWPSDEQLVEYACAGHGYGGDDGYYGVTYPSDLDEYQKLVDGEFIRQDHVQIAYWDGDIQTLEITEVAYLEAVKARLNSNGKNALASIVQALITTKLSESKQLN
jgi:hypothetical protein